MRKKIRNNVFTGPTSGILEDFLQLNVLIIPDEYADDFELFANLNPKAIPVIERGKPLSFSLIGENIDIIRDVPKYRIHEGDDFTEVYDLQSEALEGYTVFAVGCSYTFESALIKNGIALRHIQEKKNVAMYNTSIPCRSTEKFSGNMVVSMRPIKKELLSKVFQLTADYSKVHGLPIHVGHPKAIGIEDISKPDYGEFVEIKEDEWPVFWACGVTSERIVKSCVSDKFYTHAPGHMLISEMLTEHIVFNDIQERLSSVLLTGLENRGLFGISHQNDLLDFATKLLIHQSYLLISGFCVGPDELSETDGPVGTVFLARALSILGKRVIILTDRYSKHIFEKACDVLDLDVKVTTQCDLKPDVMVAIERPGMSIEGKYHNMSGVDISSLVEDTDTYIRKMILEKVPLFAIGDGGNEVGMGKVKDYIKKHIPFGRQIAAEIPANELLISGVSNWGAYAVIGMISYVTRQNLVQSSDEENKVYDGIISEGAVDGVTKRNEKSVDGYTMEKNLEVLNLIHDALRSQLGLDS